MIKSPASATAALQHLDNSTVHSETRSAVNKVQLLAEVKDDGGYKEQLELTLEALRNIDRHVYENMLFALLRIRLANASVFGAPLARVKIQRTFHKLETFDGKMRFCTAKLTLPQLQAITAAMPALVEIMRRRGRITEKEMDDLFIVKTEFQQNEEKVQADRKMEGKKVWKRQLPKDERSLVHQRAAILTHSARIALEATAREAERAEQHSKAEELKEKKATAQKLKAARQAAQEAAKQTLILAYEKARSQSSKTKKKRKANCCSTCPIEWTIYQSCMEHVKPRQDWYQCDVCDKPYCQDCWMKSHSCCELTS